MKKLAFISFIAVVAVACGSEPKTENKPPSAPANTTVSNASNTTNSMNANSNAAAASMKGEKIDAPVTVKFGSQGFPSDWKWIDPDSANAPTAYDTKSGTLRATIPTGKDLFGENRTALQLLKAVEGDFQIETRVKFDPKADYQGAGILVYHGPFNYVRLERAFGGTGGSGSGIRLDARTKDFYEPITTPDSAATEATTVDLKMLRIGKTFTAFWRLDENGEWREVGEFVSDYPDTIQVGLIACNTGKPIPVEFSYIRLAPAK
jgi:beta-xylosidase